jgi:hypothetical protein
MSAPTSPSADTRPWSTARLASAGPPGPPIRRRHAASAGRRRRREGISRPPGSPGRHHAGPGDPGGARLAGPRGSRYSAGGRHGPRPPAPAAPGPDDIPRGEPRPAPLHPESTNHSLETPGTTAATAATSRRHLHGRRHGSLHGPPPRQGGPDRRAQPRPEQSGALLFAPKAGSSPLTRGRCRI